MKKMMSTFVILLISFLPIYGQINLTHGLIGYWPFDNHANDVSGKNQHGTLIGDASYSAGKNGQCLELDGFGDYVDVTQGVNVDSPEVTVSVWVYMNNLNNSWPPILTKRLNTDELSSYWFGLNYGNPFIGLNDQGGQQFTLTSSTSINPKVWVHLILTICSQKLDIFVNTIHAGTGVGPTSMLNSSALVRVGASHNFSDPNFFFNGKIDELRIYNRCLNQAEINLLFQGSVGIPESISINMPFIAPTISNGLFYLKNKSETGEMRARIHNLHSELIYDNTFIWGRSASVIDLQSQARGVYFVELTVGKHKAVQKIVIR